MGWQFRIGILAAAVLVVGLVVLNRRLNSKIKQERDLRDQKINDLRTEHRHELERAADRCDRLTDQNQTLAMQGAQLQGEIKGLREAASDQNREAFDRVEAATREMEQTRLAMRLLWSMTEKWAPPELKKRAEERALTTLNGKHRELTQ
jgi:septal ring factor EnvC (AmiA/AmiB activator)